MSPEQAQMLPGLLTLASSVTAALVILLAAHHYPAGIGRACRVYALAKGLMALAFVIFSLRGMVSPLVLVPLGNAVAVAGLFGNLAGIRALQDKPWDWRLTWLISGSLLVLTLVLAVLLDDLRTIRVLVSVVGAGVLVAMAVELLVRFQSGGNAHFIGGGIAVILAVMLLYRAAATLFVGPVPLDAFAESQIEVVAISASFLGTVAGSINFVLVAGDKFNLELRLLASTDALSGLANRRALIERGKVEVARARRFSRSFALLLLDVDHFKRINDTAGHAAGDAVIRTLGAALSREVREVDLAGRLGGEEFVILLPEVGEQEAEAIAERLRQTLASLAVAVEETGQPPLRFTVSLGGVVARPGDQRDFAALLAAADTALYTAKADGRNRVCFAPGVARDGGPSAPSWPSPQPSAV